MLPLEVPEYGPWPLEGFPDALELGGVFYHRAIRKQWYRGVLEQYREAVPRDSAHLLVLDDGNWIVDHLDSYNPDMGYPVRHFLKDHPIGRGLIFTGTGLGMLAIAIQRGRIGK